jgi:hypothetical protein
MGSAEGESKSALSEVERESLYFLRDAHPIHDATPRQPAISLVKVQKRVSHTKQEPFTPPISSFLLAKIEREDKEQRQTTPITYLY